MRDERGAIRGDLGVQVAAAVIAGVIILAVTTALGWTGVTEWRPFGGASGSPSADASGVSDGALTGAPTSSTTTRGSAHHVSEHPTRTSSSSPKASPPVDSSVPQVTAAPSEAAATSSATPSLPTTPPPSSRYQGPGLQARDGYSWAGSDYPVKLNLSSTTLSKSDPSASISIELDNFDNDERVQVSAQFPDDSPKFPGCSRKYGRCHLASMSDTAPGYFAADSFSTQSDWPRGTYRIYVDLVDSKVTLTASIVVQ